MRAPRDLVREVHDRRAPGDEPFCGGSKVSVTPAREERVLRAPHGGIAKTSYRAISLGRGPPLDRARTLRGRRGDGRRRRGDGRR